MYFQTHFSRLRKHTPSVRRLRRSPVPPTRPIEEELNTVLAVFEAVDSEALPVAPSAPTPWDAS